MKKVKENLTFNLFKKITLPYIIFILFSLIALTIARLIYTLILYNDRIEQTNNLFFILTQGLRFDIITVALVIAPALLLSIIFSLYKPAYNIWRLITATYLVIAFCLLIFVELATPSFIAQFDTRPNILFVEYLKYPKEVFSTLVGAYLIDLIIAAITVPILGSMLALTMQFKAINQANKPINVLWVLPLVICILLLSIRSSLGHRPFNPSNIAVTNDLMVNSLSLNSLYSILYAIYYTQKEQNQSVSYGNIPFEQVINIIKDDMYLKDDAFTDDSIPTLHWQTALTTHKQPQNLVIILQESLGAEFVGLLDGLPLTPNLDTLANEGLWFERMYATGTRSVRGIEAVITGFTPTAARSVVKLQKSQSGFFTLAELLKRQGYDTSFIYGGEANFDNMRSFFMGNGFDRIIEQKDYTNAEFTGSWGVSDEDLLKKAHQQFSQKSAEKKPFFSMVFSSSNHSPFEYPANKIKLYDDKPATVNNAVKYADYALGEFFKKAKLSNYWSNTLFLVVADHNSRVYGSDLVPIKRFHIPALILGGNTKPQKYSKIASQIDLVPTLLSLMGLSTQHPAIGRDLLRPDLAQIPGRAIMQYNTTQAFMQDDDVIIMQAHKAPEHCIYQRTSGSGPSLTPAPTPNDKLIQKAQAYALFGSYSYNKQSYKLPE